MILRALRSLFTDHITNLTNGDQVMDCAFCFREQCRIAACPRYCVENALHFFGVCRMKLLLGAPHQIGNFAVVSAIAVTIAIRITALHDTAHEIGRRAPINADGDENFRGLASGADAVSTLDDAAGISWPPRVVGPPIVTDTAPGGILRCVSEILTFAAASISAPSAGIKTDLDIRIAGDNFGKDAAMPSAVPTSRPSDGMNRRDHSARVAASKAGRRESGRV